METSDILSSTSNPLSSSTPPSTEESLATAASDFQTFLTLLTSQLRNQDPLAPLDSTQFVEQLASFSAVEQQIQTNTKLDTLAENLAVSGLEGATQWIGKQVETLGGAARYEGEQLDFVIPKSNKGNTAEIVISDAAGNVVFRQETDNQRQLFSWNGETSDDGTAPNGDYAVTINRRQGGDLLETAEPSSLSGVTEARLENGSVKLALANGTLVSPGEILAVREAVKPIAED